MQNAISETNAISEKQQYKFITKNRNYKDISYLGILKHLYKQHKINRYAYKDSIRRLCNNKQLKSSIYSKIHFYLCSIKSNSNKNTITAQTKKQPQNRRFITIKYQNQNYAVHIKKSKYCDLVVNKYLSNDYKELMINSIQKEFSLFMSSKNTENTI